ncbi:unnamed protein product [Cochlearia groenlandica]
MNRESKGRAWYDKIYRKFETILVEIDTSASSQDKATLESNEQERFSEDLCSYAFNMNDRIDLSPRCNSPCDSSLLEEHSRDCNQKVATLLCREQPISSQANDDTFVSPSRVSTGDLNLISLPTEIQGTPGQDKVANIRAFTSNTMKANQDEFFIEDFDEAPLDTIDLYDMTFREDPSDFDDDLLYAARVKTKQLRSFKKKIMDALTSKRRREKEYEQLAIWFGDADMGCDLIKTKEHATTSSSIDSKSNQPNIPSASEDSEWEIL